MSFWRRIIPAHILIGDTNSQPLDIKADQASIQMILRSTYRKVQLMAKDEEPVKSVAGSALTKAPDKTKK